MFWLCDLLSLSSVLTRRVDGLRLTSATRCPLLVGRKGTCIALLEVINNICLCHRLNHYREKWMSHGLLIWVLRDMDTQECLSGTRWAISIYLEQIMNWHGLVDYHVVTTHLDCNMVFFQYNYAWLMAHLVLEHTFKQWHGYCRWPSSTMQWRRLVTSRQRAPCRWCKPEAINTACQHTKERIE
jgi:hypothetical protein